MKSGRKILAELREGTRSERDRKAREAELVAAGWKPELARVQAAKEETHRRSERSRR